jgi:hypothetical protein
MAWIPIAAAVAGAVTGGLGKNQSSSTGLQMVDPSELEKNAGSNILDLFNNLQKRLANNPNEASQQTLDQNANQATDQYANLLQMLTKSGGVPSQEDTQAANQYAAQAFQGQQTALDQSFSDQQRQMQRTAAQMGRSVGDPILRAKLAQEKIRQQAQLSSNQGSFASQYAQGLGQQRLGGAEALMGLRQGLASQAIQNRMTLLNLGSQLQANERNFRIQTATRNTQGSEGGGLGGAISGGLAGLGGGLGAMSMINQGGGWDKFFSMSGNSGGGVMPGGTSGGVGYGYVNPFYMSPGRPVR